MKRETLIGIGAVLICIAAGSVAVAQQAFKENLPMQAPPPPGRCPSC